MKVAREPLVEVALLAQLLAEQDIPLPDQQQLGACADRLSAWPPPRVLAAAGALILNGRATVDAGGVLRRIEPPRAKRRRSRRLSATISRRHKYTAAAEPPVETGSARG